MLQTKRQTFAREFLVDRNATKAAIRSGYAERTAYSQGSRLLKNVEVREEIALLEREQRKAEKIDRQYVLNGLRKLAENAESEAARVRALELLGKTMRMFTEQVEVQHSVDVSPLQEFTVPELRALKAAMTTDQQPIDAEARAYFGGRFEPDADQSY
jgi:phage terminase small subunit